MLFGEGAPTIENPKILFQAFQILYPLLNLLLDILSSKECDAWIQYEHYPVNYIKMDTYLPKQNPTLHSINLLLRLPAFVVIDVILLKIEAEKNWIACYRSRKKVYSMLEQPDYVIYIDK